MIEHSRGDKESSKISYGRSGAARRRACTAHLYGLMVADEEVGGHTDSDKNDEGTNPERRQFLRVVRPKVATQNCAAGHHEGLGPEDGLDDDERDGSDTVGGDAQQHLQRIHVVNVGHAQGGEHRQVHDANAAAEITAVSRDEQFKQVGAGERGVAGVT